MKDRAVKAKDYTVTKATHTRDHMVSQPSKKINWDPNHRRPPPPPVVKPKNSDLYAPPPSRTSSTASSTTKNTPTSPSPPNVPVRPSVPHRDSHPASVTPPPVAPPRIHRETRPDSVSPPPPPIRSVAITSRASTLSADDEKIDWANLSPEDKQVFFSWLDEFFAKHLNLSVPPRSVEGTKRGIEKPATPSVAAPAPRAPSSVGPVSFCRHTSPMFWC